jgi:single-strand DNA-binding protein
MGNLKNTVRLNGNLGQDPQVKYLDNGRAKAEFSIAVNENYTDKTTREKKQHTEWVNLVAWDKVAENVEKLLRKGSKVSIDGKLRSESWQDKDGKTKYKTYVLLDEFSLEGAGPGQGE